MKFLTVPIIGRYKLLMDLEMFHLGLQEDTLFIPRLVPSVQSLPGVYYSSSGWADYNNDNIPDLALTGVTFSGTSITNLFENSEGLLSQDLSQNIEAVFGGHFLGLTIQMTGILILL